MGILWAFRAKGFPIRAAIVTFRTDFKGFTVDGRLHYNALNGFRWKSFLINATFGRSAVWE
jgi:hypothetical protein